MRKTAFLSTLPLLLLFVPSAAAISVSVANGGETNIGENEVQTDFGMVTGSFVFRIGNSSWAPSEIWFLQQNISPDVFSKGLSQSGVLELPENVTFSTCRTAVYHNQTSGIGFKVYNTASTTQILRNGTFCGLAQNGTYFVVAK